MYIINNRPENDKFDDRLSGYNGRYCYYDELSKWSKAALDCDFFIYKLLFFWFY